MRLWCAPPEADRMGSEGVIERDGALYGNRGGSAILDAGRFYQVDVSAAVLVVATATTVAGSTFILDEAEAT